MNVLLVSDSTTTTLPSVTSIERCEAQQENGLSYYLYVFILGQMLHGVGGTTIYTVGVALIDDSVQPSSTPLYLGESKFGICVVVQGVGFGGSGCTTVLGWHSLMTVVTFLYTPLLKFVTVKLCVGHGIWGTAVYSAGVTSLTLSPSFAC